MSTTKALIYWIKDHKTSIEEITNVPEQERFKGSISQVRWSANNCRYPGKVLEISDNMSDLEKPETNFQQTNSGGPRLAKKRGRTKASGVATDRDIAVTLEEKNPIPKHLEAGNSALNKEKRRTNKVAKNAQTAQDYKLLEATRALFDKSEDDFNGESDNEGRFAGDKGDEKPMPENTLLNTLKKCSCDVCKELQKHSSAQTRMFMKTLSKVFALEDSQAIKYLELLPISAAETVVELTKEKGVMIALRDKNQIKIDCSDQPNKLIKETLFVLYGREPFRQGQVTARGNRPGTFGIHPNVLSALLGFVNRNVEEKKRLALTDLMAIINKRGVDWRKEVDKAVVRQVKPASATEIAPQREKNHDESDEDNNTAVKIVENRKPKSPPKSKEMDDFDAVLSLFPHISSALTPVKVVSNVMSIERTATFSPAMPSDKHMLLSSPQRSMVSVTDQSTVHTATFVQPFNANASQSSEPPNQLSYSLQQQPPPYQQQHSVFPPQPSAFPPPRYPYPVPSQQYPYQQLQYPYQPYTHPPHHQYSCPSSHQFTLPQAPEKSYPQYQYAFPSETSTSQQLMLEESSKKLPTSGGQDENRETPVTA